MIKALVNKTHHAIPMLPRLWQYTIIHVYDSSPPFERDGLVPVGSQSQRYANNRVRYVVLIYIYIYTQSGEARVRESEDMRSRLREREKTGERAGKDAERTRLRTKKENA